MTQEIKHQKIHLTQSQDFDGAYDRMLINRSSVGFEAREVAAHRIKQSEDLRDMPGPLKNALNAERELEEKLEAARSKRREAAQIIDSWNGLVDRLSKLRTALENARSFLAEGRDMIAAGKQQFRDELGFSAGKFPSRAAAFGFAGDLLAAEATLPLFEDAIRHRQEEIATLIEEILAFAKKNSVPKSYWPKELLPGKPTTEND